MIEEIEAGYKAWIQRLITFIEDGCKKDWIQDAQEKLRQK